MFWLGTITKESVTESIKTGVTAMSAAVLELVGKK